jgi:hypothetical protein
MTRARSVRLAVHLGRSQASYSLVLRTHTGQTHQDRRLDIGTLRYASESDLPYDVLSLLQRAVWDLQRRHGHPDYPRSGAGAPGGGGGRPELHSAALDRDGRPVGGQGVDAPLPGL